MISDIKSHEKFFSPYVVAQYEWTNLRNLLCLNTVKMLTGLSTVIPKKASRKNRNSSGCKNSFRLSLLNCKNWEIKSVAILPSPSPLGLKSRLAVSEDMAVAGGQLRWKDHPVGQAETLDRERGIFFYGVCWYFQDKEQVSVCLSLNFKIVLPEACNQTNEPVEPHEEGAKYMMS